MTITGDEAKNISVSVTGSHIQEEKQKGCTPAILPECFNELNEIRMI